MSRSLTDPPAPHAGDRLPDYDRTLRAFHRAFARELRWAVAELPLGPSARVLDVPCGDGFYTVALARRLFPHGGVTAADASDAYLSRARRRFARAPRVAAAEFVAADAYALPFPDDQFDLAWCAQSLISLRDPAAALAELRRVVRPGGTVAVLEDDAFHHFVLNWPVDLELVVQQAVAAASRERYGSAAGLSPARWVRRAMKAAGLRKVRKRTYPADRAAPFDDATRRFLVRHLRDTRDMVAPHLDADALARLDAHIDPDGEKSFVRRPDAEVTCLTGLYLGQK